MKEIILALIGILIIFYLLRLLRNISYFRKEYPNYHEKCEEHAEGVVIWEKDDK